MAEEIYNPAGVDGFEFVEYAHHKPEALEELFSQLAFIPVARHKSRQVTLYKQGDITFVLNAEPQAQGMMFEHAHGPCANAMAFRVQDAQKTYAYLIDKGAKPITDGLWSDTVPAIEGIGGSALYLVEQKEGRPAYAEEFTWLTDERNPFGVGLHTLDHLTHNVHQGQMDVWAKFYEDFFNFREIRYFDITGEYTGLFSRAMTGPCGKLKIPLNESKDDQSQIAEYLREYKGEGIQHIALATDDIYATIEALRERNVIFQDVKDTYYEGVDKRLPGHGEDLVRMKKNSILIDGAPDKGQGLLLQIFTQTVIGPIFFEIIQRKGNQGFGEGNFQALFDSIELDQIRRGVLEPQT